MNRRNFILAGLSSLAACLLPSRLLAIAPQRKCVVGPGQRVTCQRHCREAILRETMPFIDGHEVKDGFDALTGPNGWVMTYVRDSHGHRFVVGSPDRPHAAHVTRRGYVEFRKTTPTCPNR